MGGFLKGQQQVGKEITLCVGNHVRTVQIGCDTYSSFYQLTYSRGEPKSSYFLQRLLKISFQERNDNRLNLIHESNTTSWRVVQIDSTRGEEIIGIPHLGMWVPYNSTDFKGSIASRVP